MSCFFQRNLYPPINTDIRPLWTSIIFGFDNCAAPKHATQTLPELISPQKITPPVLVGPKKPAAFSHGRNMHRKIHPWLEGCPVAWWDSDFVRGASEGSIWDHGFSLQGEWAVEIGSLMFFFWRQQNFKVEKFGEVLCSKRFGPDRQMDDVVLEMFISKRFGWSRVVFQERVHYQVSRSLRYKLVCKARFF